MNDLFGPAGIGLCMGMVFAWAVLGLSLSFRLLNFPDLTIEGSLPLGSAVCAMLMRDGMPVLPAVIAAVLSGMLAGALTALLHVKFRVNKFLAGIIVVSITYSVSLHVMGSSNISLLRLPSVLDSARTVDALAGAPWHAGSLLYLGIMLIIGMTIIIYGISTLRGVKLRTAGSNPAFARAIGIGVTGNMMLGLAITNGLAAFSGVILSSYQGFADAGMGSGVLILSIAAMTIGERLVPDNAVSLPMFVVFAAVVGSIAYQVIIAYAIRLGISPTDLKLATALLVMAVIVLRYSHDGELFAEDFK